MSATTLTAKAARKTTTKADPSASPPPHDTRLAWDSLVELTKDLGEAWEAADERLGDAFMALPQNPAARMPDDLKKPETPSEHALECADLTLAEKARRLPILNLWLASREHIRAELGLPALEADEQAASDQYTAAQDALIAAHPPHIAALRQQLSIVISRMSTLDPDTENGIAELLQSRHYAEYSELAQIYVHACRLAGHDGAAANFKPFDPEAWIAEFEAHPGHTMQVSRRRNGTAEPEYADPIAWGPDMPAYDAIMIADPEAIARGNAWVRAQYTDEQWADREREEEQRRNQLRQMPRDPMAPYIVQIEDQIERAYPEGHPERARLLSMLKLRSERARGNLRPIARHMWIDLEPWQQALVSEFVCSRPDSFPENRDWTYETWMEAFQSAGGTLSIDQDGSVMIGSPYPPTAQQSRLRAVVEADENLRYYVAKAVKAYGSVVIGAVVQVGGGE